jgi:hypothetical protein
LGIRLLVGIRQRRRVAAARSGTADVRISLFVRLVLRREWIFPVIEVARCLSAHSGRDFDQG